MFLIKLNFIRLVSVLHVEVAPGAYKQLTGSGWSCDQAMSPFSLGFIVRMYLSNWTSYSPFRQFNKCERVEPRSHFKSRLSLIVRLNVVLNRTVVVDSDWRFDNLCGSDLQSQSELYHVRWWYYTLVIDLIGQLRRDVIGSLSVKPWCYWLWRLVISNWCVSIRLLSQLNSRLLLVKLLVLQLFSRS